MNQSPLMQKSWMAVFFVFLKSLLRVGIDTSNVLSDGVAMAEAAVSSARERQAIDLSIAMENYEQDAIDNAALARLKTSIGIAEYVKGNSEREKFFEAEKAKLAAIVAKRKAQLVADKAVD